MTSGYASFDYEIIEHREGDLVKLGILVIKFSLKKVIQSNILMFFCKLFSFTIILFLFIYF